MLERELCLVKLFDLGIFESPSRDQGIPWSPLPHFGFMTSGLQITPGGDLGSAWVTLSCKNSWRLTLSLCNTPTHEHPEQDSNLQPAD